MEENFIFVHLNAAQTNWFVKFDIVGYIQRSYININVEYVIVNGRKIVIFNQIQVENCIQGVQ